MLRIPLQASLQKARTWIRELQRQADPNILIYLCGNKLDLAANLRQVTQEEAQKYAEEESLMWGEASAKTGDNVQNMFLEIGELAITLSAKETWHANERLQPRNCLRTLQHQQLVLEPAVLLPHAQANHVLAE